MSRVICSGNLVHDTLVHPVDEIVWGTTMWVETMEQHLGGNGANTSYTLARLGVPVSLVGAVGEDVFGDRLLDTLSEVGVDVESVRRIPGEATATTIALVSRDGARAFLHRRGVSAVSLANPLEFGAWAGSASHYHLANPFSMPLLRVQAAQCLRNARSAGLRTSLDTGWDASGEWMRVLEPCLPETDLLFVNEDEGRMLTGSRRVGEMARCFLDAGAGTVIVKLGERGCFVLSSDFELQAPAFTVIARDSTGAGDCFAGAFIAGLHRGLDCPASARLANAVGALSISSVGAVSGLLRYDETLAWMEHAAARA